ncbi:hypothetical protein BZG04_15765 [Salinivibrio kushneri]|nr:hypothetical protein BZG04_15765 [Salinivibrio kushneri]
MAIFKFYNIQLLPVDRQSSDVGSEGYCKLFKSVADLVDQTRANKDRLSAIGVSMRGGLFFSPFHVEIVEFQGLDASALIHGHFLKFDDVNELVDTNSGELEYKSSGNTSSKRFQFEFVFDPVNHIMAIQRVFNILCHPTFKDLRSRRAVLRSGCSVGTMSGSNSAPDASTSLMPSTYLHTAT